MFKKDAKALYQPWDEDAFQGSTSVRMMSPVQRWMYKSLLQSAFCCSTRPYLPNDDDKLWALAGCESKKQWLKHKEAVLENFTVVNKRPELLQNKKVFEDWIRLSSYRKTQSEKGKRSAESRRTAVQPRFISGSNRTPTDSEFGSNPIQQEKLREVKLREVKLSEEDLMSQRTKIADAVKLSTGRLIDIKDWHVREFVKSPGGFYEHLDRFRDWLSMNPGSEHPVEEFLNTPIEKEYERVEVVRGVVQDERVRELGGKLFNITKMGLAGSNIPAAKNYLDKYSMDEVVMAFTFYYNNLPDDFTRKFAMRDFFTGGGGDSIIPAVIERKRQQDRMLEIANTLPPPVRYEPEEEEFNPNSTLFGKVEP